MKLHSKIFFYRIKIIIYVKIDLTIILMLVEKIVKIDGKYRIVTTLKNNLRHSENGLPAYIKYHEDHILVLKWYKNGILHNDNDLPAVMSFNHNGQIINQQWYVEGVPSRPSSTLPDCIEINYDGITHVWNTSRLSHKDQPTRITYDDNYVLKSKKFDLNSDIIFISYYPNGNICTIIYSKLISKDILRTDYYMNGQVWRKYIDNGTTCVMEYDKNNILVKKIYFHILCAIYIKWYIDKIVYYDAEGCITKEEKLYKGYAIDES